MQKAEAMIKKQLKDLKRLSLSLKQSTEASNQVDLSLIKSKLDQIKSHVTLNSSTLSPNLNNRSSSFSSIPMQSKISNKSSIPEKYIYPQLNDYLLNEENIQPLFADKSHIKRIPSNSKLAASQKLDDQELIHLHEQNCKLQFQLRQMREKMKHYQHQEEERSIHFAASQSINEQQSGEQNSRPSSSPYFQLDEEVDLFFTKLSVMKEDYSKVQYELLPLKLTLDKLVIKKERLSSSKSSKSLKVLSSEVENNAVQLYLSSLRQVQYEGDNTMIITFMEHEQSSKCRLFLQFDTPENMHRWDLGIYINNKIISNLSTDKIFEKEKASKQAEIPKHDRQDQRVSNSNSHSHSQSHYRQENVENLSEKQLLIRLTYYKEKYADAQKKLKEIMVNKISQNKRENSIERKEVQNKIEEKEQKKDKPLQKVQVNQFFNLSTGNLPKNKPQWPNSLSQQLVPSSIIKADDPLKKKEETVDEKQIEKQRLKKMELDELEKQKEREKIEAAVNFLKKGIFMTKYSKSAYKPHEKRVFINIENLKFCWEDKDSKEIKFVYISEIESIEEGEIGEGIKKHVNQKKLKNKSLYLQVHTKLKDRKTLQFSVANLDLLKRFIENYLLFHREVQKGNFKQKI